MTGFSFPFNFFYSNTQNFKAYITLYRPSMLPHLVNQFWSKFAFIIQYSGSNSIFIFCNMQDTSNYFWTKVSEVTQLCPTLCDRIDCSLTGSSDQGIFQARTLKWVAISSSRGSSRSRDQTCVSCIGRRILYCCQWYGKI